MRPYTNDSAPWYPGKRIGNYELVRLLGRGGFSEVYLATHIYLHMHVAIKIMRSTLTEVEVRRFFEEAILAAQLRHPHIVRVHDFGMEGQVPFLVMEYAPNGTMRQLYPPGSLLLPHTLTKYVEQVSSSLQYIHDRNLVHLDIKPENLLLGQNNELLLSDFGIAAPIRHASVRTHLPVGTVAYMAPEQISGHYCLASDQYALGVVVYEWLCGARPFQGSKDQIMQQHLFSLPPSLCEHVPSLSLAVERVVFRALAKDPLDRFASVEEFNEALHNAFKCSNIVVKGGIPLYSTRQSVHHSSNTRRDKEELRNKPEHHLWKEIATFFSIALLVGIILACILPVLGVIPLLTELFVPLCMQLLLHVCAFVTKNVRLAILSWIFAGVSMVPALLVHALVLFDVSYSSLLLLSLLIAFSVSIKKA